MKNSAPLFFVHIPKTGGTSFCLAAEAYFGKDNLIYDYGIKSKKTSDVIHDYCYKNDDLYGLSQVLSKSSTKMIAGHVPAAKYSRIVGIENTVCFIRDPAEQLISHYRHFKRDHGYNGIFAEFASHPRFNSIQSRMLKRINIEALGFLALTEYFQSSMELLNEQYGLNLSELNLNVTGEKIHEKTVVTDEMRDIAVKSTQEDRVLYDKVSNLFSKRKIARKRGHAFVHGTVTNVSSRRVSGFAFVPNSDSAVLVHLDMNGKTASEPELARLFCPILAAYKVERSGFVGFNFKAPRLPEGDKISCIATETGQILWETVWDNK